MAKERKEGIVGLAQASSSQVPICFGFHKKRNTPSKPPGAISCVFTAEDEEEESSIDNTTVGKLRLQALTMNEANPTDRPASGQMLSTHERRQADVNALREAGNNSAAAGNMRTALNIFEQALGLAPTDAVLYELKSQCHLSLEEYLEAVKAARKAVELAPHWNEGALTLGRALMSLGEVRSAVEVLSRLLGKDGGNEEVREELIYANEALMELQRREADFDLQLHGRAGLDKRELEVARAKKHMLSRGANVSSDCWLGGSEGSEGENGDRGERAGGMGGGTEEMPGSNW